MRPQLFVIAGPNGAGKSTFEARYFAGRLPFVNADVRARELRASGASDVGLNLAAGRLAVQQRFALLGARKSFAVETTLTGMSPLKLLEDAKQAGYKVNLVFIGLDDMALSRFRVQARVREGGHNIPHEDIRRRFERSIANLAKALPLVDRVWVLDNSGKRHRLILSHENGVTKRVSPRIPRWIPAAVASQLTLGQTETRRPKRRL